MTLSLYGLIHHAFPELGAARMARAQFVLAVLGGVCLPVGFAIARESHAHNILIGFGAISGAAAAILFAVMFGGKVVFAKRPTDAASREAPAAQPTRVKRV